MIFSIKRSVLLILLFIIPQIGYTEIYKCVSSNGKIDFRDSPCSNSERKALFNLKKTNISASNNEIEIDGILIVGTQKFRDRISEALDLIKTSSPNSYRYIINYIGKIEQSLFSGMAAYEDPPTFRMGNKITFSSLTWCAGSIVHDAYHSFLYHDYIEKNGMPVPYNAWGGFESEKKSNNEQLRFLIATNGPAHEIEHLKKSDGKHGDINKDGKITKEDGWLRNW